jgi:hypothetical protein
MDHNRSWWLAKFGEKPSLTRRRKAGSKKKNEKGPGPIMNQDNPLTFG